MAEEVSLEQIRAEEEELQFDRFGPDTAFSLGSYLRAVAVERDLSVVIDITLGGRQLFFTALEGSAADNAAWVRKKAATVMRFGRPSLAVRLECQARGVTLEARSHVSGDEYVWDGGSFPIILRGTGVVGTVSVSGLPDVEDHALVVEGLRHVRGRGS